MTKQEFIERTGMNVSDEQYGHIENIYYNAEQLDKDVFCADYKRHHESIIIDTLNENCEELHQKYNHIREEKSEMVDFLIEQAEKWSASDLRKKAIDMIGAEAYIAAKIKKGFDLWQADKDLIVELLTNK